MQPLSQAPECLGLKLSPETSSLDLNDLREKAKSSLYFFAKGILGYDWLVPHIHLPLCKSFEDESVNRRCFVLPRGWLKTTVCTIAYPIWKTIRDPNLRILLTQNSATNAVKKLAMIRSQWETNPYLHLLFPELLPTGNSTWRSDSVCLSRTASWPESTYEAAGTNTRIVSRHYDIVIEDDTVAPDLDELGVEALAPSCADVEKAIGWHRLNVLPILNNPNSGQVVVVGTRWYEHDLIAWIMANEPHYQVIHRACRENDKGETDPQGRITYPERFNEDVLGELERTLGPYLFSCLYMNRPVRTEDMLFKPSWIRYYETAPSPRCLAVYTTFDTATDPSLAKGRDLDYSVVMTCGQDLVRGHKYVLEYTQLRGTPGELVKELFRHVLQYDPIVVGYDDVAFERSMNYWLKELMRQENLYFILQPIPVGNRSKPTRIQALQPIFASGSLFIRSHMKELESELLQFPLGRHDDIIDTLSMQLHLWRTTRGAPRIVPGVDDHPLSFERAMREIRERKRGLREKSLIFDPLRASRSVVVIS